MIGLVLAEDKYMVRQGLISIDWNKYGIQLLYAAEDGLSALKAVREKKPHIVLTDIKMPKMDGLKLLSILKEESPDIKGILISGYRDFEYAKSAVDIGAFSYILKPVNPSELIDVVVNAKRKVENEMLMKKVHQRLEYKVKVEEKMLYDSLLSNIFHYKQTDEGFISNNLAHLDIKIGVYALAGVKIGEDGSNQEDNMRKAMRAAGGAAAPPVRSYVSEVGENVFLVLLELSDVREQERGTRLREDIKKIKNSVESAAGKAFIAVSNISREFITDINDRFVCVLNCLNFRFENEEGVIYENDLEIMDSGNKKELSEKINEIVENVKIMNYPAVDKLTDDFMECVSGQLNGSEQLVKEMCIYLIISGANSANAGDAAGAKAICEEIDHCADIYSLTFCVKSRLKKIMDQIKHNSGKPANQSVDRIMDYIGQHYMEELTLAEVAGHVHLSPVYISRLIKKEKNQGFVEILTGIRIENACELIKKTDLRVYEICEKVGFKNPRYFGEVFKKHVGVTLSKYRQMIE